MGIRLIGLLRFTVPLLAPPDLEKDGRRGAQGAYLLGLPFGLAGCPICAPVLTAVAASGNPLMGALAMLALGLGQGTVLVAAGAYEDTLTSLGKLARHRATIEWLIGLSLLLAASYFAWQAFVNLPIP